MRIFASVFIRGDLFFFFFFRGDLFILLLLSEAFFLSQQVSDFNL